MKKILLLTVLLILPFSADAATLYLSPSSGSYTAGKPFTVTAYVASADQSMNAVSATIAVDASMFSIVSASSVGSIVNFWVQQPVVSGSNISLEGVVLNPGYQGGGAKVASFVLMPKSSGSGAVSFSSASVLANDGQGSNILDATSGASFTIQSAPATPVAPTPTPVPVEEREEGVDPAPPAPATDTALPPQITNYGEDLSFGDLAAFRGVTYENATIEFLVYQDGVLVTTEYTESNSSGDFSIVIAKRLDPGTYEVRVRTTTGEGIESEYAGPFPLVVRGDVFSALEWFTMGHLALLALVILAAIGGLSILHAAGFRRLFKLAEDMHARQSEHADVTRRVFTILRKDLAEHVRKIKDAGETRVLTKEELTFLEEFAGELEEAETALQAKGKRTRSK